MYIYIYMYLYVYIYKFKQYHPFSCSFIFTQVNWQNDKPRISIPNWQGTQVAFQEPKRRPLHDLHGMNISELTARIHYYAILYIYNYICLVGGFNPSEKY